MAEWHETTSGNALRGEKTLSEERAIFKTGKVDFLTHWHQATGVTIFGNRLNVDE